MKEPGTSEDKSAPTLKTFLEKVWLPAIRDTIRPNTHRNYVVHVRYQLVPALGDIPLDQLDAQTINRFYASLLGTHEGRPLASATVRRVHATLRKALRDAERWGLVAENVCLRCDPPKIGRGEITMKTWSPAQLATFLTHARSDPRYPLWLLIAMTGLRRGEALGLRWCDVDLDRGQLYVCRAITEVSGKVHLTAPKTSRGRRVVAIDERTVATLREHRANCEPVADEDALVFSRPDGAPLNPGMVTRWFQQLAARHGLPRIRLHDLRHTHATIALQAGVHPKIVSERLGHSAVSFTLDVYSHAIPHMQAEAAEEVARLVLTNNGERESPRGAPIRPRSSGSPRDAEG